ncbi:hypothetical protein OIU77_013762 [Salix suchowensis]|uniref:Uncharacterized protein n=1 Tax=Salix suchowensis TaxID=1278906 RepID=A0ABQ8ZUY3_9ROSI|nr:hypothetical protein OIU77_013762 [Salix suchowensis]
MTNLQTRSSSILKIISSLLILLHYPTIVSCECTCEVEDSQHDKGEALKYKLGSILSIFVAGAIDEEKAAEEHEGHVHVHTHATHGHAHGSASPEEDLALSELIRRRIVSQVLELGIVVHSVIIGISLGASSSPETIKPLMAALCFHQFFEGMGLGGCITLFVRLGWD